MEGSSASQQPVGESVAAINNTGTTEETPKKPAIAAENTTAGDAALPAAKPADVTGTDDPAEPGQPPAAPLCGICNENIGKYKCTRCKLPFCSVACNKIHKENHPPDPDPPAVGEASHTNGTAPETAPAPGPDPKNPFSGLDNSQHLQYLFKRYPGLPRQLLAIGAETDPPAETQHSSLKEALLAKAAAVGKPRKEQWNHDVGIRKGKEALRKARRADGDMGEGIREYTELIVHLTSQNAQNREAEALLRQQATQRDTELIRQLLEEEKR